MMRPNDRLVHLVDAALGERTLESLGTLKPSEEKRISHLREVVTQLQSEWHRAPEALITQAASIMPNQVPRTARVLTLDYGAAMARSGHPRNVHAVYDCDGLQVRIMAELDEDVWHIMGSTDEKDLLIECRGAGIVADQGRFEITAPGVTPPELELYYANSVYILKFETKA